MESSLLIRCRAALRIVFALPWMLDSETVEGSFAESMGSFLSFPARKALMPLVENHCANQDFLLWIAFHVL